MRTDHPKEGKITVAIEKQTSKIPSAVYLSAGLAALGTSMILKCCGCGRSSLFVGQFASPFLIMGLYNKIVKTEGHD